MMNDSICKDAVAVIEVLTGHVPEGRGSSQIQVYISGTCVTFP